MSSHQLIFNHDQFRDLVDNASDLIHFATPEGILLYVNPAWEKTLGFSLDEMKGRLLYHFMPVSERENFIKFRERIISGKTDGSITTIFIAKDGKEITVEASVSCKYENEIPVYTRAILRNITARIENEKKLHYYTESLRQSQEYINQLLLNAPDAVIVIDESSNIIFWNKKAEDVFGWSAAEIQGKGLSDTIIPERYKEGHNRAMQRIIQTGETRILNKTVEISALKKSGQEFPISLTISRSTRMDNQVFISFIRDITEQKRKDNELAERTVQLEKSNFELEQYASLTSHDLKEPLRKILLFSDILLTRNPKEISKENATYIRKIHSIANHMNELVEAVLHYSIIDQEPVKKQEVNLNAVIQIVMQNLEIEIADKKATIHADKLPVILANPMQMIQLFQNLVSNSLKYSKQSVPPVITIRYVADKKDIDQIIVEDNGIGFENEYAEKIFGIFERLQNKSAYPGTGIGLAICRKIVLAHKGAISADGNPGKGAKFIIDLPAVNHPVHMV